MSYIQKKDSPKVIHFRVYIKYLGERRGYIKKRELAKVLTLKETEIQYRDYEGRSQNISVYDLFQDNKVRAYMVEKFPEELLWHKDTTWQNQN